MVCFTVWGKKKGEFCFVLQECTICCEIVTASKWVWKKKEHMKHLHNQVYLGSAVRKLNRTNSYMLKITTTANVMPQKLLNQFQHSLIWLRQSVLFAGKCNGIKIKRWILVWKGGIGFLFIMNKRAVIWLYRSHYFIKSGLSWDSGRLDSRR